MQTTTSTLDAAKQKAKRKGHRPTEFHNYPRFEGVHRCFCDDCEGVLIVDTDPDERTFQGNMTRRACPIGLPVMK